MNLAKRWKCVLCTKGFEAFIFSVRAALSAVAAFLILRRLDPMGALWASISAVIVTQPGLHPSLRAALLRCGANLIGVFVGALLVSTLGSTLFSMAIGVVLTGMICHFARLDDAVRPAFASVVIVMHHLDASVWHGSLDRVGGVVVGCAVAMAMTVVFDICFARITAPCKEAEAASE